MIHVEGSAKLQAAMLLLSTQAQKKVARPAATKAAKPILNAFKSNLPEESGALKEAANKKIKIYGKTGGVTAIIGVRSQYRKEFNGQVRRPVFYFHLVEDGFVTKSGVHVPGTHALHNAFAGNSTGAKDIMADECWRQIQKLVSH